MPKNWEFLHDRASDAKWTEGLRKIFEYRNLGLKEVTDGNYTAQIIRASGDTDPDEVNKWHVHHCDFQFLLVLQGWAEFEYEGEGIHRIEKGDVVNQLPGIKHREIKCSDDFEVLEIVSPAKFETIIVEAP